MNIEWTHWGGRRHGRAVVAAVPAILVAGAAEERPVAGAAEAMEVERRAVAHTQVLPEAVWPVEMVDRLAVHTLEDMEGAEVLGE